MNDYRADHQKRQLKQFFMAVIFIFLLAVGWFHPMVGYFIPLCMVLGLALGVKGGRKWCDWYCPRGSFYDAFMGSVSPKRQIPSVFKNIKARILVALAIMTVMTVNLVWRWPDPMKIGKVFIILLTVTTALGVVLSLIFHHRSWCYLCPVGTSINLVSRKSDKGLKINSDLCIECELCGQVCPVQIKPYKYRVPDAKGQLTKVDDADCIKCGLCVSICPKKALEL